MNEPIYEKFLQEIYKQILVREQQRFRQQQQQQQLQHQQQVLQPQRLQQPQNVHNKQQQKQSVLPAQQYNSDDNSFYKNLPATHTRATVQFLATEQECKRFLQGTSDGRTIQQQQKRQISGESGVMDGSETFSSLSLLSDDLQQLNGDESHMRYQSGQTRVQQSTILNGVRQKSGVSLTDGSPIRSLIKTSDTNNNSGNDNNSTLGLSSSELLDSSVILQSQQQSLQTTFTDLPFVDNADFLKRRKNLVKQVAQSRQLQEYYSQNQKVNALKYDALCGSVIDVNKPSLTTTPVTAVQQQQLPSSFSPFYFEWQSFQQLQYQHYQQLIRLEELIRQNTMQQQQLIQLHALHPNNVAGVRQCQQQQLQFFNNIRSYQELLQCQLFEQIRIAQKLALQLQILHTNYATAKLKRDEDIDLKFLGSLNTATKNRSVSSVIESLPTSFSLTTTPSSIGADYATAEAINISNHKRVNAQSKSNTFSSLAKSFENDSTITAPINMSIDGRDKKKASNNGTVGNEDKSQICLPLNNHIDTDPVNNVSYGIPNIQNSCATAAPITSTMTYPLITLDEDTNTTVMNALKVQHAASGLRVDDSCIVKNTPWPSVFDQSAYIYIYNILKNIISVKAKNDINRGEVSNYESNKERKRKADSLDVDSKHAKSDTTEQMPHLRALIEDRITDLADETREPVFSKSVIQDIVSNPAAQKSDKISFKDNMAAPNTDALENAMLDVNNARSSVPMTPTSSTYTSTTGLPSTANTDGNESYKNAQLPPSNKTLKDEFYDDDVNDGAEKKCERSSRTKRNDSSSAARTQRKECIEFNKKIRAIKNRAEKSWMPLHCSACGAVVKIDETVIRIHVYSHSKVPLYACHKCEQTFQQQHRVLEHVAQCHPNEGRKVIEDRRDMKQLSMSLAKCFPRPRISAAYTPRIVFFEMMEQLERTAANARFDKLRCQKCSQEVRAVTKDFIRHVGEHSFYKCNLCKYTCEMQIDQIRHQQRKHSKKALKAEKVKKNDVNANQTVAIDGLDDCETKKNEKLVVYGNSSHVEKIVSASGGGGDRGDSEGGGGDRGDSEGGGVDGGGGKEDDSSEFKSNNDKKIGAVEESDSEAETYAVWLTPEKMADIFKKCFFDYYYARLTIAAVATPNANDDNNIGDANNVIKDAERATGNGNEEDDKLADTI